MALIHGHTKGRSSSRTYVSWQSMVRRCTEPSHRGFARPASAREVGSETARTCRRDRRSYSKWLHANTRFDTTNVNGEWRQR